MGSNQTTRTSKAERLTELEVELIEISRVVRLSLDRLKGPLKHVLRETLHNSDHLPDARCYSLAAEAIDALHEAQQSIEPRTMILADHFLGYTNSKCLNAAIERGVADILALGPATLKQLSQASKTRPDRLRQILRALYNNGIFEYDEVTGLYRNNDVSTMLCTDHPTQWRNWVVLYGNQFYDIARGIPQCTMQGEDRSAAQINYNTDLDMFHYFQQQGWTELLHKTLGGGAEAMAPGIRNDYPWGRIADGSTVVLDIGGGGGGLISMLLRNFKQLRGAIFDLPHVIEHAKTLFHGEKAKYNDVAERIPPESFIGGNFFHSIPSFEVYTMKWVLHDWNDEESIVILRNIRKAIKAGTKSRLIIMEAILSNGRASRLSRYADINMMMTAKGRERTEDEWRGLAASSGWDVREIYNLRNAWFKAIELVPAGTAFCAPDDDAPEFKQSFYSLEWMKHAMGNELLHCPVNCLDPNLRILDYGPGNSQWLFDMAKRLPSTSILIGADSPTHIRPSQLCVPPNITLISHSISDQWPSEFEASFDCVSQRTGLVDLPPVSAEKAVSALFSLLKPGGWIQLLECDYSHGLSQQDKGRYPATSKLYALVDRQMYATGKFYRHTPRLRGYLREAGAIDVVEILMDLPIGCSGALTPALQAITSQKLLSVVNDLRIQWKKVGTPSTEERLDEKDLDNLCHDLAEELSTQGSWQRFHLLYGRRPQRC